MSTSALLPQGFETLEGFAQSWAVAGSDVRRKRRIASTAQERDAFYAAAVVHLDRALEYLDEFALDRLDARQQRLLDLMLMLAHVSLAVEKQGANEALHAINHAHFTITRSAHDAA
ncbi:MAG: hypothetical protein AB7Q97_17555 [Gammaproteobacteria bacterium]